MRCAFVLVLLLVLITLSSSGTTFEKPWYYSSWLDSNPNIFYYAGHDIWVDLQSLSISMHGTINSLDLSAIDKNDIRNSKAVESFEKAKSAYDATVSNYKECSKALAANLKIVNCFYLDRICQSKAIVTVFFGSSACISYDANWKTTMSNSVDVLAYSLDNVSSALGQANTSFERISYAGLCDSDYHGAAKSYCNNITDAFASITSGSLEGGYGSYNILMLKKEEIKDETWKQMPNMENFSNAVNFIWQKDNVMDKLIYIREESAKAENIASSEFLSYELNANTKKKESEALFNQLKNNKAKQITEAVSVTTGIHGSSSLGTIAERYNEADRLIDNASKFYNSASSKSSATFLRGYRKQSIEEMKQAYAVYNYLASELVTLESDAEAVVKKQKLDAENAIHATESSIMDEPAGSEARKYLLEASNYLEYGKTAAALGDAFAFYEKAEQNAKIAKSKTGATQFTKDVYRATLEKELEALILAAKKDKIFFAGDDVEFSELKSHTEVWVTNRMKALQEDILSRAKNRYGYLEQRRKELLQMISLADGEADDLLTTIQGAEKNLFDSSGSIVYKNAIGQLLTLEEKYLDVEKSLNYSLRNITANSMLKTTSLFIDKIELDKKSNITFNIQLINPKAYGAKNVPVKVGVADGLALLYSDIKKGQENISTVLNEKNQLLLFISEVRPYSTYSIRFEKEAILASTTKESTQAEGLGDGTAKIRKTIDFDLEMDTYSFKAPDELQNTKIDGSEKITFLKRGKHTLTAEYIVEDAYDLTVEKVRVFPIGLNSKMEYEIVLLPRIALDKVIVFVDTGNDDRISSLSVYSLSGAQASDKKSVEAGRYNIEVKGLQKNQTTRIFVGYLIENSSSYVNEKITEMEKANLSVAVKKIISDAKNAANSSNWTGALEKLKEAEKEIEKEKKENNDNLRKAEDLKKDIEKEFEQLSSALSVVSNKSINSSFISKLQARAVHLEKTLNGSKNLNASDALNELGGIDRNWLKKELTEFRKSVTKEYNELKATFINNGNFTTPVEFLNLESALNSLEAGNSAEYVPDVLEKLGIVQELVKNGQQNQQTKRNQMENSFDSLKKELRSLLSDYKKQYSAAKGSEIEQIFTYDSTQIEAEIKALESAVGKTSISFEPKFNALNETNSAIKAFMDNLKKESERKLRTVEELFNSTRQTLPVDAAGKISKSIESMKTAIASGNYVAAIKSGNLILSDLQKARNKDDTLLWILGITAIAIVLVAVFYMHREKERKKSFKQEFRKMKRME